MTTKIQNILTVLLLCIANLTVFGQQTQTHKVDFSDIDGFSGEVNFTSSRHSFGTTLKGKGTSLVLKNYRCTPEEKEALKKAGIDFWRYSGYSPKTFGVYVEGRAYVNMVRGYSFNRYAKSPKILHLNNGLGDEVSFDFDEDTKEYETEWKKTHPNKVLWLEEGGFSADKVTELYLSDLKNEIDRILYTAKKEKEKEEQAKKEADEKQKQVTDLLSEAQKALWSGDLEKAKPLLDKAYKLDPSNQTVQKLSGEYAQKKDEKAKKELDDKIAEGKRERETSAGNTQNTNNSYRHNNVSATQQKIATIDKAHSEFNNTIDQAFESSRQKTKEAQQKSRDYWEGMEGRVAALTEEYSEKYRKEEEEFNAKEEQVKQEYHKREQERKQLAEIALKNREESKYDYTGEFTDDGVAVVMVKVGVNYGKYGLIDKTGQEIVPPKYDYMDEFSKDGLAVVKIGSYPNEKCGFIDKTGREITPLKYDIASSFSEGMAMVGSRNLDNKNNKVGFIDTTGKVKIAFKYHWAKSFSEGLAVVLVDDKGSGFINKEGQFVISPIYDLAHSFSNGKAKVELDGREFYIDKTGKEVK
ncbi:WG repeat-containing protein [Echinicola marina]|uniref:WG repeat-containing protein n=1 Tax=Echinicola marina TaxID=2859768 RepID=UPI001CF64C67|nr:WG repeat-containing protein [Echinicola marina]UCS92172.1 WG repeat-containing protein [Echinicola marina]